MKVLSKVLLITLLAAIFGLTGCIQNKLSEIKSSIMPLPEIESSNVDNSVTVLFPQKANVKLIGGVSKIGWVNINPQAKQIEVSLNRGSEMINFARIKKVNFDLNRAVFSDGDIVIKGKESSDYIQDSWTKIPVSNLNFEERETSKFTVKLNNSGLNKNPAVRDGIYIVEEILFHESSKKMTLKVLCCIANPG